MLRAARGNLFAYAQANCIIAHGCNARGVMASGFAASLRALHPEAYAAYIRRHLNFGLALGSVVWTPPTAPGVHVANCITQMFYGRDPTRLYVDYEAVGASLAEVARKAEAEKLPVHLPFIGGGLANGDREKLLSIFKRELDHINATLWLN